MAELPTTELEFDTNLNRLNSLLQGLAVVKEIPANEIGQGVFGASNNNAGVEFGISKTNNQTYIQSRDFVTGSTGWQINSNGNVEFNSGTFRGDITASTISIGTNGWHVDINGNMWWGSDETYGTATVSISAVGLYKGAIFQQLNGARIDLGGSLGSIEIYSASEYKSTLSSVDTKELRLRMEQAGGYVTLVAQNDGDSPVEVLRADGDAGVTIGGVLTLNATNISIFNNGTVSKPLYINQTSTTTAKPSLHIENDGLGETIIVNQSRATNSDVAFTLSNAGTGRGILLSSSLVTTVSETLYAENLGKGYAALFASTDASGRQLATVGIFPDTLLSAHLHLEPGEDRPSSPTEGDLYADTDHKLYYHNGTDFKEIAFV